MKNELKISTVSIICVLCASVMSGAHGASSVRTLGGTGTYTSAASASQSGGSTGVARAGSVRVSPTTVKATSATPGNSPSVTAGRVASSPRLSLGKYLGSTTAISGGSSVRPGTGTSGSSNPGLSATDAQRIDNLEDSVASLKTSSQTLAETKQDKLTGDNYIEIDSNGNVLLLVDNLKADLAGLDGNDGVDGNDGREVVIATSSDDKYIVWQYAGETSWRPLIEIAQLVGPQGEKGEKGEKGDPGEAANLDLYSTTAQMNAAIAGAINDAVSGFVTSQDLVATLEEFPTNEEMNTALSAKANASDVYTKADANTKFATKDDLLGVETGAGTALADALQGYAKTDDISGMQVVGNLTQTISAPDSASESKYTSEKAVATAIAGKANQSDLDDYVELINSSLDDKADKSALNAKANKADLDEVSGMLDLVVDDLDSKADKSDVYSKAEVDSKIQPVTSFESRMEELTTTVEQNMQNLTVEMNSVNTTINNITNVDGQVINIAPQSITSVELKDGSVTSVKLAEKSVSVDKIADPTGVDPDSGPYLLLVGADGQREWVGLTPED